MRKILEKIFISLSGKKTTEAPVVSHEKIRQAVEESNRDQREILKEYDRKFSAAK